MPPAQILISSNYLFRVTGTNRTLKQRVVFAGTVSGLNQVAAVEPVANYYRKTDDFTAGRQIQTTPAQSNLAPLLNSRISGRLTIGNGREVEIQAVPTKP